MSKAVKTLKRTFGTVGRIIKPGRFSNIHAVVYNSGQTFKEGQSIFVKKEGAPIEALDFYSENKTEDQITSFLGVVKTKIPPKKSNFQVFSEELLKQFTAYLRSDIAQNLGVRNLHQYNFCLSDKPHVSQNRSLGFRFFPLLDEVSQKSDEASKALMASLDNGVQMKNLQKYFNSAFPAPWATNGFLRRMQSQHVPSLEMVSYLGEAISYGLTVTKEGKFDKKSEKEFLARITNISLNNEAESQAMWNVIKFLKEKSLLSTESVNKMILNIGNEWSKNEKAIDREKSTEIWTHYFRDILNDLLFPAFLEIVKEKYLAEGRELPTEVIYSNKIIGDTNSLWWSLKDEMSSYLSPTILAEKGEMARKSAKAIFSKRHVLLEEEENLKKEGLNGRASRYSLFPNREEFIDGWTVKSLVNSQDLVEVGDKMKNCLNEGERARIVKSGEYHFISLTGPDGILYAGLIDRCLKFHDGPHVGKITETDEKGRVIKRDIQATPEQTVEINAILQKLKKTVGLNGKQGLIENEFTQNIKSNIGFDPLDSKRRQDIFDEYQKAGLFPYQINCNDSQQFVEKLNLSSLFEEQAVKYKQKLDSLMEKEVPKAEIVRKPELVFSFGKDEPMMR